MEMLFYYIACLFLFNIDKILQLAECIEKYIKEYKKPVNLTVPLNDNGFFVENYNEKYWGVK